MAINLPNFIEDRRMDPPQGVVGDSWNWYATEPTAAKKWIAYHHSASPTNQDGGVIAQHHVNKGWSGCGYHFVIRHDDHPRGAGIEYVGDLITWRAGITDRNNGVVHVCMVGNFLNHKPGKRQLELARQLNDFFLAPNMVLPSINFPSQISYHNALAAPGQGTACPGWQAPFFNDWFNYLKGGAFPHHFYAAPPPPPAPVVVTPPPAPVPEPVVVPEPTPEPVIEEVLVAPTPGEMFTPELPEWERTWLPDTTIPLKVVAVPSTDVVDATTGQVVKKLPGGEPIKQTAGYFQYQNDDYVRTQWSVDNNKWYGVLLTDLKDFEAPFTVTVPVDTITAPFKPVPSLDQPALGGEVNPPEPTQKMSLQEAWAAVTETLLGLVLSPLRLFGYIQKLFKKG